MGGGWGQWRGIAPFVGHPKLPFRGRSPSAPRKQRPSKRGGSYKGLLCGSNHGVVQDNREEHAYKDDDEAGGNLNAPAQPRKRLVSTQAAFVEQKIACGRAGNRDEPKIYQYDYKEWSLRHRLAWPRDSGNAPQHQEHPKANDDHVPHVAERLEPATFGADLVCRCWLHGGCARCLLQRMQEVVAECLRRSVAALGIKLCRAAKDILQRGGNAWVSELALP